MKLKLLTPLLLILFTLPSYASDLPPCPEGTYHNCFGTYTFPSGSFAGDKYVGEFKNDKFNGEGTYTYPDGYRYEGEYKDGERTGKGIYTYSDGSKYVGEFKDGKKHGQGTNTWADGREISGIWDDSEYLYKSVEKNLFEFLSNT